MPLREEFGRYFHSSPRLHRGRKFLWAFPFQMFQGDANFPTGCFFCRLEYNSFPFPCLAETFHPPYLTGPPPSRLDRLPTPAPPAPEGNLHPSHDPGVTSPSAPMGLPHDSEFAAHQACSFLILTLPCW